MRLSLILKATIKPKKPGEIIKVSPDTEEIVEKDKAQKKDNVKTKKPEEIINISPDTEEVVKKAEPMKQEKAGEGSLKKKAPTLTLTFCAAACGLSKKPKEQIAIDAADVYVEYVEEIYKFYKSVEGVFHPVAADHNLKMNYGKYSSCCTPTTE
ncbi:Hypothetical predicted protein [Olea europaea subsp. europaea]|uniref:Uncharacterized protein n=1 Tax=Olea europaea subsp. europaea TaxID=158383 RepID=A0A8S0S160_OLEEU|nr:Hypothetical predicted protein [Olea europaea subsp. europaea]